RADRAAFLFAGLWECWHPPGGEPPVGTFTILTTTPNTVAAPVHNRMPVILSPAAAPAWLDEATPPDALQALLAPAPDDLLARYRVSQTVNSARNDSPECVEPLPCDTSLGEFTSPAVRCAVDKNRPRHRTADRPRALQSGRSGEPEAPNV
ncbi:MAG: SOS response-associated peptidase, partial [Limisphaerales bacterium]